MPLGKFHGLFIDLLQKVPGAISVLRVLLAALPAAILVCPSTNAAAPATPVPILIYTDILSGPNRGGENDKGIYLSLFGKNFGGSGLGSTIKVYMGDVEADNYRYLGPSRGRPDLEQITVQVGALGNPAPGTALPIKLVVNGITSNSDLTFTVNPGKIYFVSNGSGPAGTGADMAGVDTNTITTGGGFSNPFRSVQKGKGSLSFSIQPASLAGAWGRVQAGDFIVMRGGTWTDKGYTAGGKGYFLYVLDKSGSSPGVVPACAGCRAATGTGPITLMGYPGEDVFVNQAFGACPTTANGVISSADSARIAAGNGSWISIVNLRIEGGNFDGVINTQAGGSHWRIVNNELTASSARNNTCTNGSTIGPTAGGIAGNGTGQSFLGNHIHDIYDGPEGTGPLQNHGIYIDGDGSYEIGYNLIGRIPGGNGIQTYATGRNGSNVANNVNIHHNEIRDAGKHGINVADGTQSGIRIYNNVVLNSRLAGLRFNTTLLHGAKIYNNTFYKNTIGAAGKPGYGSVMNDARLRGDALDMRNNIFVAHTDTNYAGGSVGFAGQIGAIQRNLWHAGRGAIDFDSNPVRSDPRFVAAGVDFHLGADSPAIDAGAASVAELVKDDFGLTTTRPQGKGYDIGAYELPQ